MNVDVTHVSALIQHPGNGEARNAGQEFDLRGTGCSVSLGDLTDDALFSWTSSIDGALGTGRVLFVNSAADPLTPGTHGITLTVSDGLGNVGTEIVSSIIN